MEPPSGGSPRPKPATGPIRPSVQSSGSPIGTAGLARLVDELHQPFPMQVARPDGRPLLRPSRPYPHRSEKFVFPPLPPLTMCALALSVLAWRGLVTQVGGGSLRWRPFAPGFLLLPPWAKVKRRCLSARGRGQPTVGRAAGPSSVRVPHNQKRVMRRGVESTPLRAPAKSRSGRGRPRRADNRRGGREHPVHGRRALVRPRCIGRKALCDLEGERRLRTCGRAARGRAVLLGAALGR